MANVRIDNLTDDTITVFFDGKEYTVNDEEKFTVDAVEKGRHTVRIHRTRVPMETEDFHETDKGDIKGNMEKSEKSLHTQLDAIFDLDINSGKSVITVKTKVEAKEKFGIDAIFSGYSVEVSGGKVEKSELFFANKNVGKNFILHHLKDALFPVGAGGIFLLILGIAALAANFAGKTVNIGGTDFSWPWSALLTAVGLGFVGYTIFVVINTIKTAKKFDKK